ncbi:MT-A70-domain-containing protein [Sporormia fimetaria CBS 119925]|uniref:MT-A70-domain-containing protein n=1 Tax=Sporormia fimetaria CBS 119925 TaxID=1340428 RepID=A0A6A6VCT4_9PLEO|nr:MT-A70-domain-containing protein [Sporormia fimetaria CBS 119925]
MPPSLQVPGRTAILYQTETKDITLIDIPASIAIAQGRPDAVIRSTSPLEEPFVIRNEPKSAKAKERHAQSACPLHDEYKVIVSAALSHIQDHTKSLPWCLPRRIKDEKTSSKALEDSMEADDPGKELDKLLREWSTTKNPEEASDFDAMMATLSTTGDLSATSAIDVPHPWTISYRPLHKLNEPVDYTNHVAHHSPEPWEFSFHNPTDSTLVLTISPNPNQATTHSPFSFFIPPRSTFFLGDVRQPATFRNSFRALTENHLLPRHFDFILLDPPWPSGSAKRKGNYEQVGGMPYMRRTLESMNLDTYIEHNALVGIWITNKQSARDLVLEPGGLFEQWNVGLIEEWIWVKTTAKGEPMFSIDSQYRKPYEILLLGRAAPNAWTKMEHAVEVKRRIVAAVPDLHSRKPCLKELVEEFLPEGYAALEVFARYLVAGWTCWGNEVLKFNWEEEWERGAAGTGSPLPRSPGV